MPGTGLNSINLSDNKYTVKQKAIRNAYKVYDSQGKEVLSSAQKMFKMKEEFPFKDTSGNEIFTVKADQIMDIAGDYVITDSETGERIAVLEKDFTWFMQSYRIRDRNDSEVATIKSRGKAYGLLRALSDIFHFLPHKYTIKNDKGEKIGVIAGKFGLRDRYEITLEEDAQHREAILASAITMDALEGD